ncbi:TPA: hypothetical protein VAM27_003022 [Acinetobacter baumannii]|uniref:hypothetical protein n=1 Tax=Acinetobacter calcoaceticus/baumannii complex TaxID=909768 RepID=UPI00112AE050|nr:MULTISPECIES: hypothetical protein [Acinetobacter calcoaceticus/baumannii complex]MCU4334810.1 hypothetical protein [Acinetobacter pittii]TPT82705.1 hypothetical protein FJU52_14220 [Acinetobacter baumannii]HEO1794087.1 hypothetical protein [Acinetobacter baumannii]
MKSFSYFFLVIVFSFSSLASASTHIASEKTIDHYGTGNDGDNTSGLLLKDPLPVIYSNSSIDRNSTEERIDHYGTGNDGDNTSGLLLKDPLPVTYSNSSVERNSTEERIDYYGTGNDGDNTSGLLLKSDVIY